MVNGKPAQAADRVSAGDAIEVEYPEAFVRDAEAEQIPLEVLFEDGDLAVINKPAGMVVHPAPGHYSGTLVHALLGRGGAWSTSGGASRPGIVHRLDKGTSGLIVVARNDLSHRALAAQLSDRTLSRTYLAIVRGRVNADAGVLEGPIGRHPRERKRMAVVAGGRHAVTRYQVIERRRTHTLLRCDLDTGRTHQIRVHLAAIGLPIVGDPLYGGAALLARQALHATRLDLRHPVTEGPLELLSPLPKDLATLLSSVEIEPS